MSGYWSELTPHQQQAFEWRARSNGTEEDLSFSKEWSIFRDDEINDVTNSYNNYLAKQAEIKRIKADTAMTEETARQDTEKARRFSEFISNNEQRSSTGNKSMLSASTGFAKLRRKVLGSLGGLGSSDEKLGG